VAGELLADHEESQRGLVRAGGGRVRILGTGEPEDSGVLGGTADARRPLTPVERVVVPQRDEGVGGEVVGSPPPVGERVGQEVGPRRSLAQRTAATPVRPPVGWPGRRSRGSTEVEALGQQPLPQVGGGDEPVGPQARGPGAGDVDPSLSINGANNAQFKIVVNQNEIKLMGDHVYQNYEIYSIDGKQILKNQASSNLNMIDISNLNKGIYILNLKNNTDKHIIKFVKY
jgi:hypothetical protein